jgi:hypothetical protein
MLTECISFCCCCYKITSMWIDWLSTKTRLEFQTTDNVVNLTYLPESRLVRIVCTKRKQVHQNELVYAHTIRSSNVKWTESKKHLTLRSSLLMLHPSFFTLNPSRFVLLSASFNFQSYCRYQSLTSKKPFLS